MKVEYITLIRGDYKMTKYFRVIENEAECRYCIVGEHHYAVSCNKCPERIARAKDIVTDIVAKTIIEFD